MKLKLSIVVLAGAAFFFAIAWAAVPAGRLLIRHYGPNYKWQGEQALNRRDAATANKIATARGKEEYYDFAALRLLARALLAQTDYAGAVQMMFETIRRERQAEGRSVYVIEPDLSEDYDLLGIIWRAQDKHIQANEAARIAAALGTDAFTTPIERVSDAFEGVRVSFRLEQLQLSEKVSVTTAGARLTGNGEIAGTTSTLRVPVGLQVSMAGSALGGIYPIAELWINGVETAHLYADSTSSREITVPLDLTSTGTFSFQLRYVNDAYEPATRADRNLTISAIALVEAP